MNITVFGSTGAIGGLTVDEILESGHTVTVYARNPQNVPAEWDGRVRVVIGEMSDSEMVDSAVEGPDADRSVLQRGGTHLPASR